MGLEQGLALWVRVVLRVVVMKGYMTLFRVLEYRTTPSDEV